MKRFYFYDDAVNGFGFKNCHNTAEELWDYFIQQDEETGETVEVEPEVVIENVIEDYDVFSDVDEFFVEGTINGEDFELEFDHTEFDWLPDLLKKEIDI